MATPEIARDENPVPMGVSACPWIGYDDQSAATIARFVSKASPSQAREVGEYERAHNDRAVVVSAADRRIEKWNV
jgi:hypothetical protein